MVSKTHDRRVTIETAKSVFLVRTCRRESHIMSQIVSECSPPELPSCHSGDPRKQFMEVGRGNVWNILLPLR